MARQVGVSRWTYADWEEGKSIPSELLPALAKAVCLELTVLVQALVDRGEQPLAQAPKTRRRSSTTEAAA